MDQGKMINIVPDTGKDRTLIPAVGINLQSPGNADRFTTSDNYFWLEPNESETVEVNMLNNLKVDAWNLEGNEFIP